MSDTYSTQAQLKQQLKLLLNNQSNGHSHNNGYRHSISVDVIVAHCEINSRHGVGVLLKRIFTHTDELLSIRSKNLYDGVQDFGKYQFLLSCQGLSKEQISLQLKELLGGKIPRRILTIPYFPEDVLIAIVLKELSGAPMCTYIMDDQNIHVDNVSDELIGELLHKSDLCLGISRELCDVYEQKYQKKSWLVPPVVERKYLQTCPEIPRGKYIERKIGTLIGNIWSQQWLNSLAEVMASSGVQMDWYGNPNRQWLNFDESQLQRQGINFKGYIAEEDLIQRLRESPYIVLPTGSSNSTDDRPEIACFSLPSRLPFIVATANTPIIVLGRKDSAAARFVQHFHLGVVCGYDSNEFREAVEYICSEKIQTKIRQKAAAIAPTLSAEGVKEWLWQSLKKKQPMDDRYEELMPKESYYRAGEYLQDADVVITVNEVSEHHGTGALVSRIFAGNQQIISIRSCDHYTGEQEFGRVQIRLPQRKDNRLQAYQKVIDAIGGHQVGRIFCVPYSQEEILTAMALRDMFNVPLATYIMDDQNIGIHSIPDHLMAEFLNKCTLRLATHPELRDTYEQKYGVKLWLLPAIAPYHLANNIPHPPSQPYAGALVGSVWSKQWFSMLTNTLAGGHLDWYGNYQYSWLRQTKEEITRSTGIVPYGVVSEAELSRILRDYAYAVVPTGTLDERDDRQEISRLSLPGRIIFIMVTTNTPIIIVGSKDTCAARFVERFNIGVVCDYDKYSFREAVEYVCQSDVQITLRQNAAKLATCFSDIGIQQWVWESLAKGEPIDGRFEEAMVGGSISEVVVDVPTPEVREIPSESSEEVVEVVENIALPQTITLHQADALVVPNELNDRHGTGTLVKRLIAGNDNILCIRSENHFGGEHHVGALSFLLPQKEKSRYQVTLDVLNCIQNSTIKRIFCVPYNADELETAIALHDLFHVPMATYIMDDQNIGIYKIPDSLMQEFLEKCTLRFATHPELRDAYEHKYGLKFWLLPAIVPKALVELYPQLPIQKLYQKKIGALVGSMWSQQWYQMLKDTLSGTGIQLDWYGNYQYYWMQEIKQEIAAGGIIPYGVVSEAELAQKLRDYPYAVVPSGTLDERDDRPEISRLSMPGRIIFIMATAGIPIILLGNKNTSAAHFIQRFNIGVVCDYNAESFLAAAQYICQPFIQLEMRKRAAQLAASFSDEGIQEWIWQSLAKGEPIDSRFENLMPRGEGDLVKFVEPPVPKNIYKDYVPVYQVMRRLQKQGYQPDFVVDVGASFGIWSFSASGVFDNTRYVLIDPLISRYHASARNFYLNAIPRVDLVEVAVSDRNGELSFQVSPDLYGSSLLHPADFREYESVTVEVKTLDCLQNELQILGRGILKLDVQCAEHIVLAGASNFIQQVDLVIAELSLVRYDPQAMVMTEMIQLLQEMGFRYYDETGEWRSPVDGTLLQKEIVFIREDLFPPATSH